MLNIITVAVAAIYWSLEEFVCVYVCVRMRERVRDC